MIKYMGYGVINYIALLTEVNDCVQGATEALRSQLRELPSEKLYFLWRESNLWFPISYKKCQSLRHYAKTAI